MTEKLRDCFDEMVVYKDLKKSNFFSALGLPSFLRDWLLKKFADDEGNLDIDELTDFIRTYLPNKEEWVRIKDRIINDNERVKLLTKISVDISIKTGEITFSLPDFGLTNKETMIDVSTWDQYRGELISGQEVWGVVELGYRPPDDTAKPKIPGKIRLTGFTNFCPYTIDLDYYKDVRNEFTTSEWIDVLLGAIDYNAGGYESEEQKLSMLTRILPFVEKRLNLIELAPKGTGKSYVFGHVSKYGLLTDGGKVTRAKMFYDTARKTPGFVTGHDFIAIDEVKLVQFGDVNEMRSIMQGYMEYGQFNIGGYEGKSDAGIIFLGNIAQDNMDEWQNIKIDVNDLGVDMLSASAHKFHGPKGIGFLYVRKGTPLAPYASGGSQENHMRAGTENIASIVGMAAALKKCVDGLKDTAEHLTRLETKLIMGLSDANVRFSRNGSAAHIPGNISLSFPGYSGEALLHRLDLMGICVSTGSACNSRETQISHVLQAIKLEPELAKGTIRLSLGKNNTEGDIDEIVDALLRILK